MSDRWWRYALCRGQDTDLFFSHVPADIEQAKSYCRVCPVLVQCRDYALRYESAPSGAGNEHKNANLGGVFGGMTWGERRLWKKRRRALRRRAS